MLPENWKNEIQEAIDKAARRTDEANQRASEIQIKISAGIDAVAEVLNKQNEKHDREDSSKRSRETWTLCALGAAAIFTLGLDVLSGSQLHEMQKVYGPINRQAEATKKSADAARDAADAAIKQVEISADVEKRQLRAYIGVVPPTDNQIINRFIPPEKPIVHLAPRNFGLTPAYNALTNSGMNLEPYPLPPAFDYPIEKGTFQPNKITIYPGAFDIAGIIADAGRALTDQEIAAIQDGLHQRLYVWGTVTYDDAFGDHHFTNFCIGFYGLTAQHVQREPCEQHNDSN
jgi:hypothetical protein